MDKTPISDILPPGLRFLKPLVMILTGTMILGLVAVIWLLVIRLPASLDRKVVLPQALILPEGAKALAYTVGPDWYAVVTNANEILIFDNVSGKLRQTLKVAP